MDQSVQTWRGGTDLIFRNGTILTMIDERPQVVAVAVADGASSLRATKRRSWR